jgi:hypothetical protein
MRVQERVDLTDVPTASRKGCIRSAFDFHFDLDARRPFRGYGRFVEGALDPLEFPAGPAPIKDLTQPFLFFRVGVEFGAEKFAVKGFEFG